MQQDMIKPLEHIDADSVEHAIDLLQEHGKKASLIAGNTDEINWMKNRQRAPEIVIDLKPIDDLRGVSERDDGGLRIGALASVNDVANDDVVRDHFAVLADAAAEVATPQIRNQGTIGGNVAQDSRCWYYRAGFDCYRAGGNTCYAITGEARDHVVTDFSRCITSHPSDSAVAFQALGADVVIQGSRGERREPIGDFFVGPEQNITVMNDLANDEVLTEIRVPPDWRDAAFYFEKVRDRDAWDFPIVNIAAAVKKSGNRISDLRLVSNGVAPTPKRLTAAERAIRGAAVNERTATRAGKAALPNAAPLPDNAFKIPLAQNLVKRALLNAE